MNERIKELAVAAGYLPDCFGVGHWDMPEFKKFAALIVLECVNSTMDGTKEGDHYAQRIEQHFDNGQGSILHFGVQE